ncbi:MAG: hypothetical protein AAF351_14945 [Pseudomonadota bacterium]
MRNSLLLVIPCLWLIACSDDAEPIAQSSNDSPSVASEAEPAREQPQQPQYFFRIYGTEPDDGPGHHFPGACEFQDDNENLLLFSIYSPGHRNGGGKGGSNPPTLHFSRTMTMQWVDGREANKYQDYRFEMRLRFERQHKLITAQTASLNRVATVAFGKQQVPIYRVDDVAVPGILKGYHAWFRVLETNHPPYTVGYSGTTGNLYAHFHLHTVGRSLPDNNPWTDEVLLDVFESFYTQPCFVDYLQRYISIRDDAIVEVID